MPSGDLLFILNNLILPLGFKLVKLLVVFVFNYLSGSGESFSFSFATSPIAAYGGGDLLTFFYFCYMYPEAVLGTRVMFFTLSICYCSASLTPFLWIT